jgi:hypothetical protein
LDFCCFERATNDFVDLDWCIIMIVHGTPQWRRI